MSISISDETVFCLFSLIDMAILGDNLLFLIEKATGDSLRHRLSALETGLLSIVLGSVYVTLFLLIISPFHALNEISALMFTIVNFLLFSYRNFRKIKIDVRMVVRIRKYVPVIIISLFALIIRYQAVLGLYMSSGMDIFGLSCYTHSIISAGGLNLFKTLEYGDVWFTYPSGYLGIAAYISVLLHIPPERTITLLTPLFTSLVYACMFAIPWKVFHNYWMGLFSAALLFLTYFPMMFVWGGDSFTVSTFFFLVFLIFLFNEGLAGKTNTVILGLLLGETLSVYPMLLLSVLGCALPLLIWKSPTSKRSTFDLSSYLRRLSIVLLCAFVVSAFTDIQIISGYLNTFNLLNVNNGKMPDITSESSASTIWQEMLSKDLFLNFPLTIPKLIKGLVEWFTYSVDSYFKFESILLASLSYSVGLLFLHAVRNKHFKPTIRSFFVPVYMFLWFGFLFGLAELNPHGIFSFAYRVSPNIILSEFSLYTDRIIFMSTIPMIFFIGYLLAVSVVHLQSQLRMENKKIQITIKRKYSLSLITSIIMVIYVTFAIGSSMYVGSYHYIATVKELSIINTDDYNLILWIRDNLPHNASILVNPGEGGQLIPAIANVRIAFPKGTNQGSRTYQYVVNSLINDPSDPNILHHMEVLNVKYIYCGSGMWYSGSQHFNVIKMSQSSNYQLIKNVGNAWLFKIV